MLPIVKTRRWTAGELEAYCRENLGGGTLSRDLIERWLASAVGRGLIRELRPAQVPGEGTGQPSWEITDRGFAYRPTFSKILNRLGGPAGLAGIVSLLIGIASDQVGEGTRGLTGAAFFLAAVLLVGYVMGASLAERGGLLLKRVAARETEVQQHRLETQD